MRSASSRPIARPRPNPLSTLVALPRWKRSKTCSRSSLGTPGPCWARADPAACARVVRILIDNALRYAPRGEPIEVTATVAGNRAAVRVADYGPGVPEDEREHVFERFHRGKATSAESGFGLGLAIGRELAERMGGTLELAASEHGASFVLTLPASPSSPTPSPAPDSAAAA